MGRPFKFKTGDKVRVRPSRSRDWFTGTIVSAINGKYTVERDDRVHSGTYALKQIEAVEELISGGHEQAETD